MVKVSSVVMVDYTFSFYSYQSSFRASDSHPVADNPGWKKNAAGFDYNPR